MKISKLLFLSISMCICLLSFTSCGDDIDCNDMVAINEELEPALDALLAASNAYIANPTDSDACNDFKNATEDFISQAKDLEECVPDDEIDEYRNNIEELESELDDLEC